MSLIQIESRSIPATLDVREIAPRDRHPLILGTFDRLGPGESFILLNDHDPKPLYYQFQAEQPGQLDWTYLEQGPEVWRVRIGRVTDLAATPILELIGSGDVRLVVNTPTPQSGAVRDAVEIRLAATAEGILCLTAIETAVAAAEALDPAVAGRIAEVRSLGEWVPGHQRVPAEA